MLMYATVILMKKRKKYLFQKQYKTMKNANFISRMKTEWTRIQKCQSFWIISNISFGMPMLAFSVFYITQEKVPY